MRCATLPALCSLLAACATPAPVVITDVAEPLECPQPEVRKPSGELVTPLVLEVPALLPAGEGDYGLTREGVEQIIDAFRALREREALWRAWAY